MPTIPEHYLKILTNYPIGHLATADQNAHPHLIPICYSSDGVSIVSALDQKPKSTGIRNLKRVKNIISNPQVALLIDHYDDDWQKLWYVLISGTATLLEKGEFQKKAIGLLVDKYPQYQDMCISKSPVIRITPTKITSWGI